MRALRMSLVGTVILALLGGLGGVALAQEDTHTTKVTHVTGTRVSATDGTIDDWWEADGIGHGRGLRGSETIEWSDPRLPSELQMVQNLDAPGQEVVVTGATLLEDAEGYFMDTRRSSWGRSVGGRATSGRVALAGCGP